MTIAFEKCSFLSTGRTSTTYILNGQAIPPVKHQRDLGISFDGSLTFRKHIVDVACSAARTGNVIFRTLISDDPALYCRLYNALVVPKLTYCSPVWSPSMAKDCDLLQRTQNKFLARLARRCNLDISHPAINLKPVMSLHIDSDIKVFRTMLTSGLYRHHFDIKSTRSRQQLVVEPKMIAKSFAVNSCFPWRICHLIYTKLINTCDILQLVNTEDLQDYSH